MRHRRRSPRRSSVAGKRSRRWRSDERSSDGDTSSWRGADRRPRVQRSVRDCRLPMQLELGYLVVEAEAVLARVLALQGVSGEACSAPDTCSPIWIDPISSARFNLARSSGCVGRSSTPAAIHGRRKQPWRPATTSENRSPRSATMTCARRSSGRSRPTSRLLLGGLEDDDRNLSVGALAIGVVALVGVHDSRPQLGAFSGGCGAGKHRAR